ncbi:MAG TPA: hypothetical protein VJH65_03265 [Candidatus Nanoarchaeia archaeon]|nr:hypothetical protein [Candidatus Nanoarchaeia archaeon]
MNKCMIPDILDIFAFPENYKNPQDSIFFQSMCNFYKHTLINYYPHECENLFYFEGDSSLLDKNKIKSPKKIYSLQEIQYYKNLLQFASESILSGRFERASQTIDTLLEYDQLETNIHVLGIIKGTAELGMKNLSNALFYFNKASNAPIKADNQNRSIVDFENLLASHSYKAITHFLMQDYEESMNTLNIFLKRFSNRGKEFAIYQYGRTISRVSNSFLRKGRGKRRNKRRNKVIGLDLPANFLENYKNQPAEFYLNTLKASDEYVKTLINQKKYREALYLYYTFPSADLFVNNPSDLFSSADLISNKELRKEYNYLTKEFLRNFEKISVFFNEELPKEKGEYILHFIHLEPNFTIDNIFKRCIEKLIPGKSIGEKEDLIKELNNIKCDIGDTLDMETLASLGLLKSIVYMRLNKPRFKPLSKKEQKIFMEMEFS